MYVCGSSVCGSVCGSSSTADADFQLQYLGFYAREVRLLLMLSLISLPLCVVVLYMHAVQQLYIVSYN